MLFSLGGCVRAPMHTTCCDNAPAATPLPVQATDQFNVFLDLRKIGWRDGEILDGGELKITNGLIVIPEPTTAPDGRVGGIVFWDGFTCNAVNSPQKGSADMLVRLVLAGSPPETKSQKQALAKSSFSLVKGAAESPIKIKGYLDFSPEIPTSHAGLKPRTVLVDTSNFIIEPYQENASSAPASK